MRSSYPISLFTGPPQRESGPSAFVVSIVLHSVLFSLLLLSVRHVRVVERLPNRKYTVRLLDVHVTQASVHWFPQKNAVRNGPRAARHAVSAGGKLGTARISRVARISRNFESQKPAPQTMIQPEVPPDQRVLPNIPIPQAVVWTPGKITQRKITTPAPQPTGAIQVKPSLAMPSHELNPAEISLSSTPFATLAPMPAPGTTSPVDVSAQQPAKQIPVTASKDTAEISPARVISLSDMKLESGTAALPVVNEVASSDASGSPSLGEAASVSQTGNDKTDSRQNGTGAGQGAGNAGENADGVAVQDGSNAGSASDEGFTVYDGSGGNLSSGSTAAEHITLPKNGQYGMVVVGASPQESYPETADLWTGRMVYTVYLQSDTAQNWILQYSRPRSSENKPGDGSRPDPPWAYDMMRPNLSAYKDVVLVHGFVNADGRFERLSVSYPPDFIETDLLLRALKKWEFRPAMNEGQPLTVEILLIIPMATE
ncbi:MAG: hypothetical protein WA634_17550 [Silvibacterium sp.]